MLPLPGQPPEALARHPLTAAGLDAASRRGRASTLRLGVPVIGLGASAPSYYGAVGERLGARMILPEHAGRGQCHRRRGGAGGAARHGPGDQPRRGAVRGASGRGSCRSSPPATRPWPRWRRRWSAEASARARRGRGGGVSVTVTRDIREAEVEGRAMFIEATVTRHGQRTPPRRALSGATVFRLTAAGRLTTPRPPWRGSSAG